VDHPERRSIEVAQLMSVMKTGERVDEDPDLHGNGQPTRTDPVERLPVEVLHGDEVLFTLLPDFVRLHDVGMTEPGCQPRLVQEHAQELGLPHQLGVRLLQHNKLVEARGPLHDSKKNVCHPAAPDLGHKPIPPGAGSLFRSRHRRLRQLPPRNVLLTIRAYTISDVFDLGNFRRTPRMRVPTEEKIPQSS
jgi:hypothetical protein